MQETAFNPYLPSYEYIPDGEPRVFRDRLYLYGSHDRFGGNDFCQNDYVCWSASVNRLNDWKYEGVIYKKSQDPRSKGKLPMYAPDVVQGPDGRYYLYYSVQNTSVISVAVCDTPAGQYEYYGDLQAEDGHIWGTKKEDWFEFDPAVLVDEDGRIWIYSGSGQKSNGQYEHPIMGAFVRELKQDMKTTIGEPKVIMPYEKRGIYRKPYFFEGSSIRKIGQLYYFVYCATNMTGLNYCTSRYPDKDFVYRGCIHNTAEIGIKGHTFLKPAFPIGNYHGGIAKIGKDYYIFDHRMTNKSWFSRQGVAEKIQIKNDGSISQVENTSCGLSGGSMPWQGCFSSHIVCGLEGRTFLGIQNPNTVPYLTQSGEDRENSPDQFVAGIRNGSRMIYRYFVFDGNNAKIEVEISGEANGMLYVSDGKNGKYISRIMLSHSGNKKSVYKETMKSLAGKHEICFVFKGKGMWNLHSFSFQ